MKEFKMAMLFAHGVAYQNTATPSMAIENIIAIINNPSIEIAVSREDQPLGGIGVYCSGTVLAMYPYDCQSKVIDGHRQSLMRPCTLERFLESKCTCEAFVTEVKVESIWIKESYLRQLSQEDMVHIDSIIREYGLTIELAPEYYPVWNS